MKSKHKLSEIIQVNPPRQLKKNEIATFVSMDDITINQKKISRFSKRQVSSSKTTFQNGDVLLAKITPSLENGKTVFVDILKENEIAHGSTEFFVLSGKENISLNLFVYYIMRMHEFRQMAIQSMTGTSGRQRVQQTIFDDFEISLPSISTQEKICSILGGLDEQITILHNQNKVLEQIAQTIFKSWFVDFDGVTEFGDSELGKIPKGWHAGKFLDVIDKIESGKRPKGGINPLDKEVPSIGAENILGLGQYNYSKTKYISLEFFNEMKNGKIKNNDVLLYKDGASLGRRSLFRNNFPFKQCCINEHVFILRTNKKISSSFLFLWLDQKWMEKSVQNLNSNSAQPGINRSGVLSLSILIPDINVINNFERLVDPILAFFFKNRILIESLTKIHDTILPKLMSGEIKV